jgi:hypothetical protein
MIAFFLKCFNDPLILHGLFFILPLAHPVNLRPRPVYIHLIHIPLSIHQRPHLPIFRSHIFNNQTCIIELTLYLLPLRLLLPQRLSHLLRLILK